MRRRDFITLLGGAAAAWPFSARGQQARKVYRVGVLETISKALNAANLEAFRKSLRGRLCTKGTIRLSAHTPRPPPQTA
jgi:putative ABC transport system substrate-binding protein